MKNTQIQAIKNHLETNPNGITSFEAIQLFGATRLSGIIYCLKHKYNMNIVSEQEKVKSRYGYTYVARYKLKES